MNEINEFKRHLIRTSDYELIQERQWHIIHLNINKLMKDKILVYNTIVSIEVNKKNVDDSINYINVLIS